MRAAARRLAWILWLGVLAAATAALVPSRTRLDKAHVVLVYLLVILAGSLHGGRRVGLPLAGLAFLLFNWFFLPPFGTFVVADPFDWLVLVAFLTVGAVAAELLHRLQREAAEARRRADEVDRLAALGAETLNVVRAEEALGAIAGVIRTALGVETCRVHVAAAAGAAAGAAAAGRGPDSLADWVLEHGRPAAVLEDGTTRLGDAGEPGEIPAGPAVRRFLPLRARDRIVGVLELGHAGGFELDPPRRRFVGALGYYAALAAERVRLSAEADRAEALREADRLKDALLAAVSHDLRTPLTTIKAHARALGEHGEERALVIEQEADRLARLVTDLLELSRLQGGALALRLELNAADDVVGAALQRAGGALAARPVHVRMEEGGTLLVGRFDFVHTLRVLVNLLENAAKYSPAGSAVNLVVRREGDALVFAVADRGPGVPEDERERIFEPFYRPPGAPPDAGGVGLGLSLARRLAEAQGGSLAHAPRPGGGSVFTLRLPAAELADVPPPETLAES
jgi:two-component system sensor histidine kinase KdpD